MAALLSLVSGTVQTFRRLPVAKAHADPENAVMGTVVRLDGRTSHDPDSQEPRTGTDAVTTGATDNVSCASGVFSSEDVGRLLSLAGGDAGQYRIYSVSSATDVSVKTLTGGGVSFAGDTGQTWEVFDQLSYAWSFVSVPAGSRIRQEALRLLDTDSSLVSFSPDLVGEYVVQLVVSNGLFESAPSVTRASVRAILVPHGRGLVPDGKFIWNYIRDVWAQVENKEWFETLWSALIQICGSELLKLYQVDFSKSIRDIQSQFQRRWLNYVPKLSLTESDLSFFIVDQLAGQNGSTELIGKTGRLVLLPTADVPTEWADLTPYSLGDIVYPVTGNEDDGLYFKCVLAGTSGASEPDWQTGFSETTADGSARWKLVSLTREAIVVEGSVFPRAAGESIFITYDSEQPLNVREYRVLGPNTAGTGYLLSQMMLPPDPLPDRVGSEVPLEFTFQSDVWEITPGIVPEDARPGDFVHFPAGPNAGFYKILVRDGDFITVNRTPPSYSDGTTVLTYAPNFYRPVGYHLDVEETLLTDTFSVPYSETADLSLVAPGRVIVVGGQAFTVLRTAVDESLTPPRAIITFDRPLVQANQTALNWRAPHTLVSQTQNFEELGVSSGDLLHIGVTDADSQTTVGVAAQVIGVDRGRLAFLLTDEFPVAGEVPDIPNEVFHDLADGFNIPTVYDDDTGELVFEQEAAALHTTVSSLAFHRLWFNTELTPSTTIAVRTRSFQIHPHFIIRNRLIPVDENLVSIPLLQEWIIQPETRESDGTTIQIVRGQQFDLFRSPSLLVENSDYVVDGETAFDGAMTFESGSNVVYVEGANFVDRGIVPGDAFIVSAPATLAATYYVAKLLDEDTLVLSTAVPLYAAGPTVTAQVVLERKKTGHFLRFIPGLYTAKDPAPDSLWAEVSFFDNNPSIEANFGILVGLTEADLEAVSRNIEYRQAVAGLMFAYTRGPIINKVRLGAQILLGLPFAENRGIIRSIEEDYRLNDQGTPVMGRILVEDVGEDGPEGTFRIYTYPVDEDSELAGIETNPATDLPYVVGDEVALFAALAKGVAVSDYLTDPIQSGSVTQMLQQFHTFRLRANDNIFTLAELSLVSTFLKKITPSYVAFTIGIVQEFVDDVDVDDSLTLGLAADPLALTDNPYFAISPSANFDGKNFSGIRTTLWDDGAFWIRKSGSALVSTALVGSPGDPQTFTLAAGGIVTPDTGEGPVTVPGVDFLAILEGVNEGTYTISDATDTTVEVSDGPTYGFQAGSNRYAIVRPCKGEMRRGTLDAATDTATMEEGLLADGVAPGDLLAIDRGANAFSVHRICRVGPHDDSPALLAGEVQVVPDIGTLSGRPYGIFREAFIEVPFETAVDIVSDGTSYDFLSDPIIQALVEPGDELEVDTDGIGRLLALDPVRNYYVPVLPAGTYSVRLCKRNRISGTPLAFDHLELYGPEEKVDLALVGEDAITVGASDLVSFADIADPAAAGIRVTDILQLLTGVDSTIDVGYGAGKYPIVEVSSTDVRLADDLTDTGSFDFKIIRRA